MLRLILLAGFTMVAGCGVIPPVEITSFSEFKLEEKNSVELALFFYSTFHDPMPMRRRWTVTDDAKRELQSALLARGLSWQDLEDAYGGILRVGQHMLVPWMIYGPANGVSDYQGEWGYSGFHSWRESASTKYGTARYWRTVYWRNGRVQSWSTH